MKHHELKIRSAYFQAVMDGTKTFEIRKDDRQFRPGDTVKLREIAPDPLEHYTGRSTDFRIGYVTAFEQIPGNVVFSLLPYEWHEGDLERAT